MPAFIGNDTEMLIQLIEAFGGPRPASLGWSELYLGLINAVQTGGGGGGGGGNSGWTAYNLGSYSSATLAAGVGLFTAQGNTLITDFYPLVTTAYNGFTPQLDLFTGGSTHGILTAGPTSLPALPLWNAAVQPGSNTNLLVAGTAAGPRSPGSYQAAVTTAAWSTGPPALPAPVYVNATSTVTVGVTQDGTLQTPTAATLTANTPVSIPFTVYSDSSVGTQNNKFDWNSSGPPGGSFGTPTITTYTVAGSSAGTVYSSIGALETAINAATSTAGAFSLVGTCGDNGSGLLTITAVPAGFAGNINQFTSAPNNDIVVGLGFVAPGQLVGGLGGDPLWSTGSSILLVQTAKP